MRLLDRGCGPGTMTLDFVRLVAPGEVVGIDREASQVEAARRRASDAGSYVRFEAASV